LIIFENGHFENHNAESLGAELALEGNWPGGVRGHASYSIQNVANLSRNEAFPDSPEHLFKLNLSVPLVKEKVFAGLEYQYTSSRHTVFSSSAGVTIPGVEAEGFGVLNFFPLDTFTSAAFMTSSASLSWSERHTTGTRLFLRVWARKKQSWYQTRIHALGRNSAVRKLY
jgi:hypothetical protein